MGFHSFILDYLQKRKAEKEAKGKSIRGLLVLLFAATGTLLGTVCGIGLPFLGLSLKASLPLILLLTSIFTIVGIASANLLVWPRIQRFLAEADDNFNYKLYLEDELENRLEKIRKSKVSNKTKQKWEQEAYEHYFDELKKNEEQINITRSQIRNQRKVLTELKGLESELTASLVEVKELAAKAKRIEEEVKAQLNQDKSKALNPASTDMLSGIIPESKKEAQTVKSRKDKGSM